MGFTSWLRNRKRHGSPRQRPTFRPTLEALEHRYLLMQSQGTPHATGVGCIE